MCLKYTVTSHGKNLLMVYIVQQMEQSSWYLKCCKIKYIYSVGDIMVMLIILNWFSFSSPHKTFNLTIIKYCHITSTAVKQISINPSNTKIHTYIYCILQYGWYLLL